MVRSSLGAGFLVRIFAETAYLIVFAYTPYAENLTHSSGNFSQILSWLRLTLIMKEPVPSRMEGESCELW